MADAPEAYFACPECHVYVLEAERARHETFCTGRSAVCPECGIAWTQHKARADELQTAVDTAESALSSSAYVGGPSEREAFRTALEALGPLATQHIGANPEARDKARAALSGPDGGETK